MQCFSSDCFFLRTGGGLRMWNTFCVLAFEALVLGNSMFFIKLLWFIIVFKLSNQIFSFLNEPNLFFNESVQMWFYFSKALLWRNTDLFFHHAIHFFVGFWDYILGLDNSLVVCICFLFDYFFIYRYSKFCDVFNNYFFYCKSSQIIFDIS